ncbi:MAG: hypothetical protein JXA37_06485 [Chloroflexia bacterium]|nr:hypothetical protein [Chloroflexia bacterium]
MHAALKAWYAQEGDRLEVAVDGYLIDIVRGDLLIEIQTGNLGKLKRKLKQLTAQHRLRLVHPIAREKWIVKVDAEGKTIGRRKSPKRGELAHLFQELVYLPRLLAWPNFSLEILLIQEEELRRHEPGRAWRRRGWVTQEHRLLQVLRRQLFERPADLLDLLPPDLPEPFSTADLAAGLGLPRRLAQRMAYCLRNMGLVQVVGKEGRSVLYSTSLEEEP